MLHKVKLMACHGDMNLKNQLGLYLDEKDMTAAQLSRRSGVSQQVISQWLRGAEPKKLTQVKNVAEALSVSVDHLCFGDGLEASSLESDTLAGADWLSGLFEVKIRRIKR